MRILRHFSERGESDLCFSDGSKYFSPKNIHGRLDTEKILSIYSDMDKIDLKEIESPDKYDVPLPFERIFLPAVNFREHSEESKIHIPLEPYFFLKFPSSLVPHEGTVRLPENIEKADYEGEIGIVISKRGKHISRADAMEYVFGYTILDDVSLRDYQFREQSRFGKNWVMGKQFDNALPVGPYVVPSAETGEFNFNIQTWVNGELRQDGSTEDMIFDPTALISYLSEVNTLSPGDLISTGTPSGVAAFTGKGFLKKGDIVEIIVPKLGILRHYISTEEIN